MPNHTFALTDAQLDEVSGGLFMDSIGNAVSGTGPSVFGGISGIAGGGGTSTPAPTNGEVYSAFFDGVKKGMGK